MVSIMSAVVLASTVMQHPYYHYSPQLHDREMIELGLDKDSSLRRLYPHSGRRSRVQ